MGIVLYCDLFDLWQSVPGGWRACTLEPPDPDHRGDISSAGPAFRAYVDPARGVIHAKETGAPAWRGHGGCRALKCRVSVVLMTSTNCSKRFEVPDFVTEHAAPRCPFY